MPIRNEFTRAIERIAAETTSRPKGSPVPPIGKESAKKNSKLSPVGQELDKMNIRLKDLRE